MSKLRKADPILLSGRGRVYPTGVNYNGHMVFIEILPGDSESVVKPIAIHVGAILRKWAKDNRDKAVLQEEDSFQPLIQYPVIKA